MFRGSREAAAENKKLEKPPSGGFFSCVLPNFLSLEQPA